MATTERSQQTTSAGVVGFMIGAVIFAALAGLLLSRLLGQRYAQEPLRAVVVAAADLPAGQPLSTTDLRLADWPVSSVPRGAFAAIEDLMRLQTVPLVPLAQGAPVLAGQLSASGAGLGAAAKLGDGQRAVAIHTDAALALARLLYPGAHVDVLATLRSFGSGAGSKPVQTKVILQNVTVLAVGGDLDPASAWRRGAGVGGAPALSGATTSKSAQDDAERRVVTLALTPEQTERLVLAAREGVLDLALRSPRDQEPVTTSGVTPEALFRPEAGERLDPGRGGDADPPR
ncbi:MAG: Flp pilus assembly protein CpaB [Proteobacteria bacterium]|nr:Flp pilus assembly protein CpaB [Pseudomonadota bacterium]